MTAEFCDDPTALTERRYSGLQWATVGNPPLLKILSAVANRRYNGCMNPQEQRGHRPQLQRLKRLDRLFTSHPLYFVTACTENRQPILATAKVYEDFRKFCEAGLTRGVFVGKYVLMPDHLHLFVAFGEEYEAALIERRYSSREPVAAVCDRRISPLSEWIKSLKNSLSKTLRGMNIPAPHWQKGFFDHVMRSEESYSEKWLYVAENPCGNTWSPVSKIGRIRERFIRCMQGATRCSGAL